MRPPEHRSRWGWIGAVPLTAGRRWWLRRREPAAPANRARYGRLRQWLNQWSICRGEIRCRGRGPQRRGHPAVLRNLGPGSRRCTGTGLRPGGRRGPKPAGARVPAHWWWPRACHGPGDAARWEGLTDSKLLTANARERFYHLIVRPAAVDWAVVIIPAAPRSTAGGVHRAKRGRLCAAPSPRTEGCHPVYVPHPTGLRLPGMPAPSLAVPKGATQAAACVAGRVPCSPR